MKPDCSSCRLYNGGNIARKQVAAMLIFLHPFYNAISPDNLHDFVTSDSDSIFVHLLQSYLMILLTFSPSVHHSSFAAFAAWSGLATLPVQRLPILRFGQHSRNCIIFITACIRTSYVLLLHGTTKVRVGCTAIQIWSPLSKKSIEIIGINRRCLRVVKPSSTTVPKIKQDFIQMLDPATVFSTTTYLKIENHFFPSNP